MLKEINLKYKSSFDENERQLKEREYEIEIPQNHIKTNDRFTEIIEVLNKILRKQFFYPNRFGIGYKEVDTKKERNQEKTLCFGSTKELDIRLKYIKPLLVTYSTK